MIIGEQPGKNEDEAGLPLIGNSGKYIRAALKYFNIDGDQVYFTNAVKHFKHTLADEKIIYQSPTIKEINACKPWLEEEIKIIQPKLIICLGLVAGKSIISGGFHFKQQRGKIHTYHHIPTMVTYHPAAILRNKTPEAKLEMQNIFLHDIKNALTYLSA